MKNLRPDYYKTPLRRLLFEQEDDAGAEDETTDKEVTEEEPAATETPEGDDEGDSPEVVGEEAPEEGDEEVSQKEKEFSLDDDVEAVLIDFEAEARRVASENMSESARLFRESTDEIDIDSFAADVARLVKNYDNLLDVEKMLVDKSKDFLVTRYGEEVADDLLDVLEQSHDIDVQNDPADDRISDLETPLAVGATEAGE
jgi:hypothetical protein